jgi:predicted dehydrogenase
MKKDTCGGQLLEQNIHLVDLLRYFFGEAKSVYAQFNRGLVNSKEFPDKLPTYETDDYSTAVITFESGLMANLMSGCFVTGKGNPIRNGLTIVGRDKSVEYELRNNVCIYTANTKTRVNRAADQSLAHDRAFLDAVRKGDPTAVRSPYPDAYKSLLLAHAANQSMETGQVVKL